MVGRLEDEEIYATYMRMSKRVKGRKVLGIKWNCESDTFHLNLVQIAEKAGLEPTNVTF